MISMYVSTLILNLKYAQLFINKNSNKTILNEGKKEKSIVLHWPTNFKLLTV